MTAHVYRQKFWWWLILYIYKETFSKLHGASYSYIFFFEVGEGGGGGCWWKLEKQNTNILFWWCVYVWGGYGGRGVFFLGCGNWLRSCSLGDFCECFFYFNNNNNVCSLVSLPLLSIVRFYCFLLGQK